MKKHVTSKRIKLQCKNCGEEIELFQCGSCKTINSPERIDCSTCGMVLKKSASSHLIQAVKEKGVKKKSD